MKILITGATGLVGTKLLEELFLKGYSDVRVLTRNKKRAEENSLFPIEAYEWDPSKSYIDPKALDNVDIVFHLAGESVAKGRWTDKKKKEILESRTKSSRLLMDAIQHSSTTPKKIISASAIGIYGNRGDEDLNSDSKHGEGFLADVCKKWEEHILNHSIEGLKSHVLRVGIVLANNGGALKQMLPPFKAGVAGILGNGKQYMSWIHIKDLVSQFIFIMENDCKQQAYNGVSPSPVSNNVFTKTLGSVLRRPTIIPTPAFGLKIIFGEMSDILLASQKVHPSNLVSEGFSFDFKDLKDALEDILIHDVNGESKLTKFQWLKSKKKEVFDFFSDEMNLEKITPPYLNFKVLNKSTERIEAGTLIDYKLSLHGVPVKWSTRINKFENDEYFIDEQIKGPYSKWVHTHTFYSFANGTLIKDEVVYKVPMGILGRLFAEPFVRKDLANIFNYRREAIRKLLP